MKNFKLLIFTFIISLSNSFPKDIQLRKIARKAILDKCGYSVHGDYVDCSFRNERYFN